LQLKSVLAFGDVVIHLYFPKIGASSGPKQLKNKEMLSVGSIGSSLGYLSHNNSFNSLGFDQDSPRLAYHKTPQIGLFLACYRLPQGNDGRRVGMGISQSSIFVRRKSTTFVNPHIFQSHGGFP